MCCRTVLRSTDSYCVSRIAVIACFALSSSSAFGWLFQPPPGRDGVTSEDQVRFEQASAAALDATSSLYGAFLQAEVNQEPISADVLDKVGNTLEDAARIYELLTDSSLSLIDLNWDLVAQSAPTLIEVRDIATDFETGSDLARIMAQSTSAIASSVRDLSSTDFGPDNPLDSGGRVAIDLILTEISVFGRIANVGSLALGSID